MKYKGESVDVRTQSQVKLSWYICQYVLRINIHGKRKILEDNIKNVHDPKNEEDLKYEDNEKNEDYR